MSSKATQPSEQTQLYVVDHIEYFTWWSQLKMMMTSRWRALSVVRQVRTYTKKSAVIPAAMKTESTGDATKAPTKKIVRKYPGLDRKVQYTPLKAITEIRERSWVKFDEALEIAVQLKLDVRKADQTIRSMLALPYGSGKKTVVAVFAEGEKAEEAKAAGADIVATDSLIEDIKAGKLEFTRIITSPDMVSRLKVVARILGPKGLMPNLKVGTVTDDLAEAVKISKKGSINIKTDKFGIVHAPIGRLSFTDQQLVDNLKFFMLALRDLKPSGARGQYINGIHLSSSMGPGLILDPLHADSNSPLFMLESTPDSYRKK